MERDLEKYLLPDRGTKSLSSRFLQPIAHFFSLSKLNKIIYLYIKEVVVDSL